MYCYVQIINLTTGIFWWNQAVGNCIGKGYQILLRKFVQDGFAPFFLLVWQHDSSTVQIKNSNPNG